MSGSDPISEAGAEYRGDSGALPPPYERQPSAADQATARARELAGAAVPDTTAPTPVSRPASSRGAKGGSAPAPRPPVTPAPGLAALPERLRSPEPPITVDRSGIKVTEIPPPSGQPGGTTSAAATEPDFLERWGSNPLTQFGLALMASRNPSLGGAIGEAGLGAITGMAAGRKEAREEKRLDVTEQRAQTAQEQAQATLDLAGRKFGLDEKQQLDLAAWRRVQEKAREDEVQIQRDRLLGTERYQNARLGQMGQALALRGKGKTADPNKALRDKLNEKLADAIDSGDVDHATELRQAIAGLGPATGGGDEFVESMGMPEDFILE
jgi:hypothetical protein